MKTASTALYWCGNVVIDRQFDQLGKVLVCVHAVTIQHRGSRTQRFVFFLEGEEVEREGRDEEELMRCPRQ